MANIHYGKIGDIWKHLPLAEILSLEQPSFYSETHAGSAEYPLTDSWERDYGVFQFFEEAQKLPILQVSEYLNVLKSCQGDNKELSIYPGSPLIAMLLRQKEANYIFCDLDAESLHTIKTTARRLDILDSAIKCIQDDGISAIAQFISQSNQNDREIFVHIDPYRPFDAGKTDVGWNFPSSTRTIS